MTEITKRNRKIVKQIGFTPDMIEFIQGVAEENQMDFSATVRLLLLEALKARGRWSRYESL